MTIVHRSHRTPCSLFRPAAPLCALVAIVLAACSGGVVVDRGGTGGGGGAGATGSGGAGASSTDATSSAVQGSASSAVVSSSAVQSSASTSTGAGSGGGGGGWPMSQTKLCFLWEADAGPCPPKEQAKDHMSMCGFSVYSVDDGPFVEGNKCCYTVTGIPNPC